MSVRISGPPDGPLAVRVDLKELRATAGRVLAALGHARSELSLALVDEGAIAELNEQWRGRKGPTDVLSFSLLEGEAAGHRAALLGDVVIAVDVAARQARARHRSLRDELAKLLIHGVLHLVGHDHEAEDEARVMRAEERRLWRSCRG